MSRICAFGDTVIDVIVELARPLAPDDDVPAQVVLAPGGQAANVAAWCAALGNAAAVITRLGADPGGRLLRTQLGGLGVTVLGPGDEGRTGTVVSLVGPGGRRTMASDRGQPAGLSPDALRTEWFAGCSWLHLSGYALLGTDPGQTALRAADLARAHGARVSVDVSAATVVAALGPAETRRRLARAGADLVFANELEAGMLGDVAVPTLVIKRGAAGCRVHSGEGAYDLPAAPGGAARDTTGAGDAFAAGWLTGGPALAAQAARACISDLGGAMPPPRVRSTLLHGRALR